MKAETATGRAPENARAKVNLYLRVVGRRADGYHLLDSLAVFPGIADTVHATAAPTLSLTIDGPFGAALAAEPNNLVLRAANALAAAAGIHPGASLRLTKNLPIASGIGGGSADAAAALRALSRLWNLALPPDRLAAIAATLGADVPVCLDSRPTRMEGIGEILSPAPILPQAGILLINPGVAVSTQAVFRARKPAFSPRAALPPEWTTLDSMARDLAPIGNDLEPPAITLCPEIANTLAWLQSQPDCRLARMSGSGATCFALFDTPAIAAQTAATAPPSNWAWGGPLAHEPFTASPPRDY